MEKPTLLNKIANESTPNTFPCVKKSTKFIINTNLEFTPINNEMKLLFIYKTKRTY